jgi:hypothetical protein
LVQNHFEHLLEQKELVVLTVAAIDQFSPNVIVDSQKPVKWDFFANQILLPLIISTINL